MDNLVPVALPADLPGKLTLTSLELDPGIPYTKWESIVQQLCVMDEGVQWWLGDALNYGEKTYGQTYTQAIETTGLKYQRLANYKWTSACYTFSSRKENLPWTHHHVAAGVEPKKRQALLKDAEDKGWSKRELQEAISPTEPEPYIHVSDDSYEWYTPTEYIEAVREVMGGIDLDPASCEEANKTVQAQEYFTTKENGLCPQWHGRVYLNPPYCMPLVQEFVEKALEEFEAGSITQAIILINNATDTAYCQALLSQFPVCFPKGRIHFYNGATGQQELQTRQGQVFVYLTCSPTRIGKFAEVFSKFGAVVQAL